MIFLNSESAIVSETLKLTPNTPVSRLEKIDLLFDDHSGGHFHLYAQKDPSTGKKVMKLSAKLPAWQIIKQDQELVEMLKESFGSMWMVGGSVDEGFDVAICCGIEELGVEGKIEKFSHLKQEIISIPILRTLKLITSTANSANNTTNTTANTTTNTVNPFTVPLGNESKDFYSVSPSSNHDQLIILFAMNFQDQTDQILAKVFLQEFYDVRNGNNRVMEDAPVVLFGKEPPKELAKIVVNSSSTRSDNLNYLTLVLFPRHYATPSKQEHLLKTLPFLSDYIHYHLKCSKAYLHQRMRAKTGDFLKMLNRSKSNV